jgi:phosphate transport system permease protein
MNRHTGQHTGESFLEPNRLLVHTPMMPRPVLELDARYRARKLKSRVTSVLLALAAAVTIVPLISVFAYAALRGLPAISWSLFTELPKPVGELGGGLANALAGTVLVVLIASAIGIPWGIGIGVFLSEYGQGKTGKMVRFCADLLASVPSIVVGLFVYAIAVVPFKHFSAAAGGLALAILMIPTIARSSEEILKLVPTHIREAGLALGLPRWKVVLRIVLRAARGGIVTGLLLSVARVAGETAPLLFTALGNRFWSLRLGEPIATLPVQIYTYAISPFDDWQTQAWAGALVLITTVFLVNLITRVVFRRGGESA